jgi:CheY-like chemotaxis protein/HD-like signal output (HDOD) protein
MDRASARHRIAELAELPASPRVLRLLQDQASQRPQPTGDIERTVVRDPSLMVALLATAPRTRAKFGDHLSTTIHSLSGLALDQLVSQALNSSDDQQTYPGPLESLRQTAVATAVAAECVARHVSHSDSGDAFLFGLLHNIGKWVLYKLDPARFARCQRGGGIDDPLQMDLETREFGYHHGEAGKWYAESRQLPQSVTDTIWLHHVAPSALSPTCFPATSIAIVALAGTIAQSVLGRSNELPSPDSTRSSLSYLKIHDSKLPEILRESTLEFARIEADEAPAENATPSHRGSEDRYSVATAQSDVSALQSRLHRLESLQQGIFACRSGISFRALVRRCAETIRTGLGVAPGMCLATDAFACELVGATWRTLDDPIADLNADLRDPGGGEVLEPTPILRAVRELGMGKIEAAWRSENAVARRQRDGLIVVPMLHEGQSQGQIAVDTSVSDFGFSDADFADLTFYARTFGAAIAQHHKSDLTTLRCEELVRALSETRQHSSPKSAPDVPTTSNEASNSSRLGRFAGGIARTLDGPLGLISSQAQRMLGKAKDIEMHRALDTIVRETRRLNRFRSDLAALTPHPKLHLEPTLINFSIHQFVAAMKSRLDRRGIRVEELYAEGLHRVMLDSRRIEHVYVNLLTLAEDAMDETGGCLTIQTGATPDKAVILQFTHNGQGISATPCGDVFEPFNERIASTTGIALAVCRSILDEHGGRISLDRGPQGGDTYTIVFPAAIPDREASSEVDHPSTASPALQTVLIVDDDEAVREILKQALLMRGFHVITAADGNQAMDAIARNALDVIILDLLMPNRDGLAVLRDLQHVAGAPPVIFMTGNASPQVREEAVTLGADRFLLKPFELRQLLEELDAIVAIRSPRPADHATK